MSNGDEAVDGPGHPGSGARVRHVADHRRATPRTASATRSRSATATSTRRARTRTSARSGAGSPTAAWPREEIWLTTKVWHDDAARGRGRSAAAEDSLRGSATDYVDLCSCTGRARTCRSSETLGALARAARATGRSATSASATSPPGCCAQALEHGAAVRRPGRVPPVPRPDALLRARAASTTCAHGLLAARPRQRPRRPVLQRDRRGARQDARARSRCAGCSTSSTSCRPEGLEPRAPRWRTSTSSTSSSATRRRARIAALPKDRAHGRPAVGARLGRLRPSIMNDDASHHGCGRP